MFSMTNKGLIMGAMLTIVTVVLNSNTATGQQRLDTDADWREELSGRITLNGYAQGGYSFQDEEGRETNDFNLKRTLLWAKARITDRWAFLFMHDFSSVVQEFYTDFQLSSDKSLTVRLGQFKNSYTMENPLSPVVLELVDICSQAVTYLSGCGSDPLHGVNYGRDMGLKIYGELHHELLFYELAVMNGQGVNRRDGNKQKDIIAKLDFRPIDGLRIVASGQKGKGHAIGTAAWNPGIHIGDDYTRDRYSIGAEYKVGMYAPGKYMEARPFSIRAEWLGGKDGEACSRGGYVTTCIPVVQGIDVIASADYFDRNVDLPYDQTNATVGFQYWFYKKCRLQMQYTHCWREFDCDYNNLQAQIQVAF